MYKILFTIVFSIITMFCAAQSKTDKTLSKPKIVVGLVIDQMRWDYLYRFADRYGTAGFKRLMTKGYNFENAFIPYVPSYTAVGHSTIYTGSVPAIDGIVGNNWWEKSISKNMYCTSDSTVQSVGGSDLAGKMSPRNMYANTIGDELRLSNNFKSKVIGIALKDRGAILPAGHGANAAYWYDESNGKFITSTYYTDALPQWVNEFNAKDKVTGYMEKNWNTLYPVNTYTQSTTDEKAYESGLYGLTGTSFPYATSSIIKEKYSTFKTTPYASSYTFDFAKDAIRGEKLGRGAATDMLTVSISSTDYAGHSFGPNSIEIEDTYLRLDQDIADFLSFLDAQYGAGNYLFFLSADHGAAHVPGFLAENKMLGGFYSEIALEKELTAALNKKFGSDKIVANAQNYQVYLNDAVVAGLSEPKAVVEQFIIDYLLKQPFVTHAYRSKDLQITNVAEPLRSKLSNGYFPKRTGDIQFLLLPGYFDGWGKGTTHGLWNPYDTHIPLLFFGWGINPGSTHREVYMTDIAPTIAAKLKIQMPNGTVGKALVEVTE